MRFKKGDKVVYIGETTEFVCKGSSYTVLSANPTYGDTIVIIDECGEKDIYFAKFFEHNKNRIVKDILEDL